jgi:hypothetical protein
MLVLAAAWLGGCATTSPKMPPPPPPPPAAVLEAAPTGMTRLYLLRPGFNDAARRESPTLLIDGRAVLDIGDMSYSSLVLAPGRHELALRPGPFDARSWAARISFSAAPNDILFLAVLKEFEPAGSGNGRVAGASPGPQPAVPAAASPGHSVRAGGVTFEFMRQVDAMPLLPGLVFIRPGADRPGTLP